MKTLIAIAAVDEGWGIGKDGKLLYSIPEDLKRFRETTEGSAVIMGSKTFASLGRRPLKGRANIVLTHDISANMPVGGNAVLVRSVELALRAAEMYSETESAFVIGGGEIYRQFLPYCSVAFITKIHAIREADTFFPDLDKDPRWISPNSEGPYTYDGTAYEFVQYWLEEGGHAD